jgi:hypothetical protein
MIAFDLLLVREQKRRSSVSQSGVAQRMLAVRWRQHRPEAVGWNHIVGSFRDVTDAAGYKEAHGNRLIKSGDRRLASTSPRGRAQYADHW